MTLKRLEINGFKSFGKKTVLFFEAPITAVVGPNGSGKSNVAEAFRWVLGEQSLKSLRGKKGEDLIFNGSSSLGRLSRASVAVTFDNTKRVFASLDFDEVTITREVFRDGVNEYAINGSKVRLKDVLELLAGISLGSSGHHIISQGEADRILNANPGERRGMIEDALGLRIYQWKLEESEKKLQKTRDNIKEAEMLRREIAPHLKFLKKQMEKVEKAKELRQELSILYLEYLKREEVYLKLSRDKIKESLISPKFEFAQVEEKLEKQEAVATSDDLIDNQNKLREIDSALREVRAKKDDITRRLGRLEGMIELKEKERQVSVVDESVHISRTYLEKLELALEADWRLIDSENNPLTLREIATHIKQTLVEFFEKHKIVTSPSISSVDSGSTSFLSEKQALENKLSELETQENQLQEEYQRVRQELEQKNHARLETERESYELRARRSELQSLIKSMEGKLENLASAEENFKHELAEAGVLIGREVTKYVNYPIVEMEVLNEERGVQEERRRKLERLKIRLEDMGGEGADVEKEFEEVLARDGYLEKELADLEQGEQSLEQVMVELRQKIDEEFRTGVKKINTEFQKFFEILFGGGSAALSLTVPEKKRMQLLPSSSDEGEELIEMADENSPSEEGIDIVVSLPRKKIKGLAMLSGGERALSSIALLFAMSQVNPPPFMILDETDAALDEANSRKYGDMIENLSNFSQLILITHNRETMSRAGILYGVTMGSDSVSRLISLKFAEAEQYAK